MYILSSGTGWFDADRYDGKNIGRYANQKAVIETFQIALEQADRSKYVNMDWKLVNQYASSRANAQFVVRHNELHVVAKDDIHPSGLPTEVFVCYGPTEEYWVPLIASASPNDFPVARDILKVLLTSEESNWTEHQRQRWSGLSLQQIRQYFP